MERRLTAFLLPALAGALVFFLLFPPERDTEADGAAQEPTNAAPGPDNASVQGPGQPAGKSAGQAAPQGPGKSASQDPGKASQGANGGAPNPAAKSAGPVVVRQDDGKPETIEKIFGRFGERGSLWVQFGRQGAVWEVRLLDEPATAAARVKPWAEWTKEDSYHAIRPAEAGLVSLAIEESDPGRAELGVDLYRSEWKETQEADSIQFTLEDPKNGLTFTKTFRHDPAWRGLRLELSIRASDLRPAEFALRNEVFVNLYGVSLVNPQRDHFFQNPAIAIGVMRAGATDDILVQPERIDNQRGPAVVIAKKEHRYHVDYAGTTNRHFGVFVVPDGEEAQYAMYRVEMEKRPYQNLLEGHVPYSVPVANYKLRLKVPDPGQTTDLAFDVYIGPKTSGVFGEDPRYERFDEVMDVDLLPYCFCTIPGAVSVARFLLFLLRFLESMVGSWGVAIIMLTFVVRGSLVPLNFRMQKAMRKFGAKMTRLKPEMDALKTKYESDPKKLQQELMKFNREHKLTPPLGGCLPMLVTIPVFLGLFTALRVAYELRLQPFMGWIPDLSQPDALFEVGLAWMPYFNILPIIMAALWFVLQSGTPLPTDPQQRQIMKIMRWMPLMFAVMLYNYASGLMVYMITSSIFGIVEQRVTKKILGPPPTVGGAAMPAMV